MVLFIFISIQKGKGKECTHYYKSSHKNTALKHYVLSFYQTSLNLSLTLIPNNTHIEH